jgi:anthranilate synthase/aminodeoxychorismate synthase-like glutamine amidotransferase
VNARVLLVDNKDSFTFNLVQALRGLGAEVLVARNDALDLAGAEALAPTHLVLSPGPGRPERAGVTPSLLAAFLERLPILGVCLGHQALGQLFGGRVVRAQRAVHGQSSRVYHDGRGCLRGLPNPFEAGRYHSLCVAEAGLARELEISAWTAEGEVMGLRHRQLPVEGVQFHPESVLTPRGTRVLANFLAQAATSALSREPAEVRR